MTGRVSVPLWCAVAAILAAGCTQHVTGSPTRAAPGVDEGSRSPVDVDAILLDRRQMQAVLAVGTRDPDVVRQARALGLTVAVSSGAKLVGDQG